MSQGPAAGGGDPFGIPSSSGGTTFNDPFGGGGSSHEDSKTTSSKDPFADPFGSDSFGSSGWAGDSSTASGSSGVVSSTPKGAKTAKKVGQCGGMGVGGCVCGRCGDVVGGCVCGRCGDVVGGCVGSVGMWVGVSVDSVGMRGGYRCIGVGVFVGVFVGGWEWVLST